MQRQVALTRPPLLGCLDGLHLAQQAAVPALDHSHDLR